MNGDKISTIFAEHPEITLEEIKRIPEILDDPVLVLKSRNVGRGNSQNTRLIVFGTEKAQNGAPVMTVLDLRPVENNFVLEDMQQVSSTYTKRNPINFLNRSDVLHADEKRTVPLLRTMGFQIPIELQQYGSLGSISYDGQNVNINGVPFSSLILNQNASNGANATNTGRNQNTSNSYGRSFDEFAGDAQRLPTVEDSTSYADTAREMRQPTSYADELAHVNELLQNAALSPRDQAYIQEDIADAQRSCDAAMKVIVNPNTTAEERAQAVQRAIDALDYARQRINDLGLPATRHEVSKAQETLADISEKLKPYLLEESALPDTDTFQPPQAEWTDGTKSAMIGTEDVLNFSATGEDFVRQIVDNPKLFGSFDTPDDLKLTLENAGFEVKPLARGSLKGIRFEDGGGYKINFSDGGILQYHPEDHSHHGGAYYKISTGKGGTHKYDRNGNELPPPEKN